MSCHPLWNSVCQTDDIDTHLFNGFHRYLLTGEGNLCTRDGQNLLGIEQRSNEDSVQTESFSNLSRFSWGLKGILLLQFLNQNRFCFKKNHTTTLFYMLVEWCICFVAIFFDTAVPLRLSVLGGGSFVVFNSLR